MFIKIHGKFMHNIYPKVIAFMVRGIKALNGIFSIFPLAGLIKLIEYLKMCHLILKQVF